MAQARFDSVDAYIASQPDAVRDILTRVRRVICRALPEVQECIAYNIPTYKAHGKPVIYFAAWKKHYSIYPASKRLLAELRGDLEDCEVYKSTIRFPLSRPVPEALIERISNFRAKEVTERVEDVRTPKPR